MLFLYCRTLLNIIIIVIPVGDTVNSYAYDGNRVRKWNVSTHKYGEVWRIGDIIGCTIDLDSGVLEFYRQVFDRLISAVPKGLIK